MAFADNLAYKLSSGLLGIFFSGCALAQNVGIGTNSPSGPLSFASIAGNKIVLWGDGTTNHYGIGVQGGLLQIYANQVNDGVGIGYGRSGAFTERLRIQGNGNIGIGTASPSVRLDITGTDGWNLIDGEGDMRIGNANTRLKFGVALGGGGIGAAGIMQHGGVGVLSIGAAGKYLMQIVGSGNYIDLQNITGGLRINNNAGSAGQVFTSNGSAASPQWRNVAELFPSNNEFVSGGQDFFLSDNNIRTSNPINFTMPANAKLLLWSRVSSFKSCSIGPCQSAWIGKIYIDGNLVDAYTIQGTSWPGISLDDKSVGPKIISLSAGNHSLTFTLQNLFANPVGAIYPQLIILPD